MRFEGIASTTAPDREGEQMTMSALESMARAGAVELRAGHRRSERLGTVEQLCREGDRLRIRGRFDERNPRARALWERLCRGARLALSVGGRKRTVRRYSPVAGRWVRMIEDAHLDHVAVCRPEQARNPEAEIVASGEWQVAGPEGEVESRKSQVAGAAAASFPLSQDQEEAGAWASVSPPPSREGGQGIRPGGEVSGPERGLESPRHAEPGRRQSLPVIKTGRTGRARRKFSPCSTGETPAPPEQAGSLSYAEGRARRPSYHDDDLWKGVL